MTWRVAKALLTLREQVNVLSPHRNKSSDGTIGDEAHASRSSDHNPWVKDGAMGIVTGMDITNDPAHGVDSEKLAEMLRTSKDGRLKYVISNRKIASFDHGWTWRKYAGINPHNHHCHISVKPEKASYDSEKPWDLSLTAAAPDDAAKPDAAPVHSVLRKGSTGAEVEKLQSLLNKHATERLVPIDGIFGDVTKRAVATFQKAQGIVSDGIAGAYTWEKLSA